MLGPRKPVSYHLHLFPRVLFCAWVCRIQTELVVTWCKDKAFLIFCRSDKRTQRLNKSVCHANSVVSSSLAGSTHITPIRVKGSDSRIVLCFVPYIIWMKLSGLFYVSYCIVHQPNVINNNLSNSTASFLYSADMAGLGKIESLVEEWDLVEHPTLPPPPSQVEDTEHWTRAMFTDATKKWK